MESLAITVVGHDRPGIIAQTAEVLSEHGMNLEDSSMTLLRGHFAMTLICSGQTPAVDLKPNTPHNAAGSRTDPPVSEPTKNAHSPAASAAAEP